MLRNRNYDNIVRFLTFFGGIGGFFYSFVNLYQISDVIEFINTEGLADIFKGLIGITITEIVLLFTIRPNRPIPIHYAIIGFLGFLIMIICHFWCGILLLIAGIIEIINRTGEKE